MTMTKAKLFVEALEAVAHLAPEKSEAVQAEHNPTVIRKMKSEGRVYFKFDDNSHAYLDAKEGVIHLPVEFA